MSVKAGFFDKSSTTPLETDSNNTAATSPIDIPLLSANQAPDSSLGGRGGAEIIVDDGVLVSSGPVGEDVIALNRTSNGEISIYTVREGDTLSHVAEMYGVTVNTILWANDLTKATSIRAGQTLIILPIAGVRHVVKKGDTINSIAKKYEGDAEEILSYNQLASADGLEVGSVIVVPGGAIHSAPAITTSAKPTKTSGSTSASSAGFTHPAPGAVKTQGIHGYNAVDLAGSIGSTIRAAAAGEVIVSKSSGWNGGYGQYIVIKHKNGTQTLYAHLSRNDVGVGAYVSQGQTIGAMGSTGKSTGPHLHFEVRGAKNPF
ncbi:MAG: peptidoglycan DD-metalloendopeptidase family protein [Candidatus Nomurabacteria bacterium]|nr:peptidoglycan DD-metalloendopeptidase family protein [Candidatus Nomurabacteria bacterium]USN87452.1 MAG: peptidoglycan DD-metalloendopeptidase family protein [Candidatus Nomurabacteria bacterium]